ncbi:hypothetical protein QWY86_18105 [Pedobacter aquatilis]|uniref:hypothetical protein n=1 Tax=Pedobacter aquatilis TaxID=351343 RepID=UPI0025B55EFB|nr:hypothetical protein [Pedobacter aquatilis]MDN3588601.1 hypothetical protein [Pedobacter aquatilis]
MIKIDEDTPTSELLSLKENTLIENAGISGTIKSIDVMVTDLYWQFTFLLNNGAEIEIRKIKNVC